MKKQNTGFTLVELLISMAILGILTTAVLNLNLNARQITTGAIAQSSMQEELRTAAAIMADEVQRAFYVFPPCGAYTEIVATAYACGTRFGSNYNTGALNVNYSQFVLAATGPTTLRPDKITGAADARTWTVSGAANNDAPILAMIVAPREPDKPCNVTATAAVGCYYFIAYYPVLRSSVVGTSKETLPRLADNDNQWVLMEYREQLGGGSSIADDIAPITGVTVGGLTFTISGTYWGEVGCISCNTSGTYKGVPPSVDPSLINVDGNLPAVYRGVVTPTTRAIFTGKMDETVKKIGGGQANILATNINPRGFQISFPSGSIDERGVTEVRIRLQGGIRSGSQTNVFPQTPLEVFSSPRNLSAGYLGR
jgi:prepilin-type N-terminal cleavage/methylation domain-containing protein